MSSLDRLAREVEQAEAGIESVAKIVTIMWDNLGESIPDEYKIRIIEAWIQTALKPQKPTNIG